MFIGSRSITWRSRIRSRNRLAEQNSRRLLTTAAGGIWLSLEERSPFLEEDFLPVVEIHDADPVLFADLRDRHVLDEVLTQDGNLLPAGIIDRSGRRRYPYSDRQTPAHFSSRASRRFKTVFAVHSTFFAQVVSEHCTLSRYANGRILLADA